MAINVATFIPAGIVIGSDNFAYQRTEDDGASYNEAVSTFSISDRYIISYVGDGFVNELPYDYYTELIRAKTRGMQFKSVSAFANWLDDFWKAEAVSQPHYYLAGFDCCDGKYLPFIMMCEQGRKIIVNHDADNNVVYYYHSCGRNIWIEKILQDSFFEDRQTNERIKLQPAMINFSKFSLPAAVSFVDFMIRMSSQLDSYSQMKQMIGNTHTILAITPNGVLR